MKWIINIILLVIGFISCYFTLKKNCGENNERSKQRVDYVFKRDSLHITNAFIENVEAIRTSMIKAQETGSTSEYWDQSMTFMPYAIRYNIRTRYNEASPLPTSSQISVSVDKIAYSSDSLFCVALVIVDNHFTDLKSYEPRGNGTSSYDGHALIGYRNDINAQFKIYPFKMYTVVSMDDVWMVKNLMRNYYYKRLAGKITRGGSNIEGLKYNYGIGDPRFFQQAPDFIKENGRYKFESYKHLGEEEPYIFHSNL